MDVESLAFENLSISNAGKKGKAKKTGGAPSGAQPLGDSTQQRMNSGTKTVEEIYQKKTQLEHILLRPDTYIGSTEKITQPMWVLDGESGNVMQKPITFVPGLYKIFDEIIVNASDNKQRDSSMDALKVEINQELGTLSVWNNGAGIPVVVHKEHGIYVPELIFGNLLTGSNFDDATKKTTGGRNGFGAKLANIFSTEFTIETADSKSGKKYRQTFRNNMGTREQPVVKDMTAKDKEYTCVTFKPDLARFKMDRLDDDTVALLSKRALDVAGCASGFPGKPLKVYLNGERLTIGSFVDYLKLYQGLEPPVAFEKVNDRWEVGVGLSDGQFQQVSFVNGICTIKGGQHVNFVADQIVQKLIAVVKKKNKGTEVKAHQIKNHLSVYVNALIENPAFDSQTKETLTTRSTAFGSSCVLSDKFLKLVEKSGIVDNILNWAKFKQDEQLKRKGGSKRSKVMGITKLDDANWAGTAKSKDCTLILTEGDSAKTLAISGLSTVGRDKYGVFPLKGKPLNVREAAHAQIMKNEEIQNIVKIMGLRFGTEYHDTNQLRYGHLLIMTDQDHDGSHIKGLLINLFHHFWPSLLKLSGFLQEFITPIVKASKGQRVMTFFTIPEYENWKEENDDGKGWTVKYYKGLGTSTAAEAKEYFSNLQTHLIDFEWQGDMEGDLIDMAFAKKRVDERKDWLKKFQKGTYVDYGVEKMSYDNFINKELILFSVADNQRSIPCFVDGLKPSQRKVLFSCFKRNLKKEIKVAQLAGYVAEHSAYHHGEASLNSTIVGMAQNFVGSNNVNFLYPSGQFGTRIMGGKDASSARYVFTRLETITRAIFHPDDEPLLNYLDEDGQMIEPDYYVPVIPTVLMNGSDGIGTGWSSAVPNYSPYDIIANLRTRIQGGEMVEMQPWYRGFVGSITPKTGKDAGSYLVTGCFNRVDECTFEILELPIKKWTQDYKQFLESMTVGISEEKNPFVKEFKEYHTDTSVFFTVTIVPEAMEEFMDDATVIKRLKLESSISTSNMHLFDNEGAIKKYESSLQIIEEFYQIRIVYYEKRKEYLLKKMEKEWRKLNNKMRFILAVIKGELRVQNRKREELLQQLVKDGYDMFDMSKEQGENKGDEEGAGQEEIVGRVGDLVRGYDYLLSMKIWSLTMERVNDLKDQLRAKDSELQELRATSPSQLWLNDLASLEGILDEYMQSIEIESAKDAMCNKTQAGKGKPRKPAAAKRAPAPKFAKQTIEVDSDVEYLPSGQESMVAKTATMKSAPAPKASKAPKKLVAPKTTITEDDISSLADKMNSGMQVTSEVAEPNEFNSLVEDSLDILSSPAPTKKGKAAPKAAITNKAEPAKAQGVKRASKKSAPQKAPAPATVDLFSPDKNVSPAVTKKARVTKPKVPSILEQLKEQEVEQETIASQRTKRAAALKKVTYKDSDSEDDIFDEEVSEESDFEEEDDDDSDFEC